MLFRPLIIFGTSSVVSPWTLDNCTSYSAPREGSVFAQAESGFEDAWIIGRDYILQGDWKGIPTQGQAFGSTGSGVLVGSGWDGEGGFRAFLEFAQNKNTFLFFPDNTNIIMSPALSTDSNNDGVVDDWTAVSGSATIDFNLISSASAQQIDVINGTAVAQQVGIFQNQYGVLPSNTFTCSFDCQVNSATGVTAQAFMNVSSSTGNFVRIAAKSLAISASSFTRFTFTGSGLTTAENTAGDQLCLYLAVNVANNVTASGLVYFRNVTLAQYPYSLNTFYSSSYISSYLVSPVDNTPPTIEEDGTRTVSIVIRNFTSPYDGL